MSIKKVSDEESLIELEGLSETTKNELKSLQDILQNNDFEEQINLTKKEMQQLDNVYTSMEKHVLDMMENYTSGGKDSKPIRMNTSQPVKVSPVYVASQVTNMISLKNLKLSMIKHLRDLHGDKLDRAFKVINQISKNQTGGDEEIPLDAILEYLFKAGVKPNMSPPSKNEIDITPELDQLADSVLEGRIEVEGIESIDKYAKLNSKKIIKEILYVNLDDEEAFVGDEDMNVLREINFSELDDIIETADDEYFYEPLKLEVKLYTY